jgi:hypothetical protein
MIDASLTNHYVDEAIHTSQIAHQSALMIALYTDIQHRQYVADERKCLMEWLIKQTHCTAVAYVNVFIVLNLQNALADSLVEQGDKIMSGLLRPNSNEKEEVLCLAITA